MRRAAIGSILLMFGGLASLTATLSAWVPGSNVDWLVTGFLVVISGGILATGGLLLAQRRAGAMYLRLPAITLVVLGISSVIGGLVSFDPLRSTVNQGLQMLLIGVLILTGVGLVVAGGRWAHERQIRYPLGILAGLLVLGLAYLTHQRFDLLGTTLESLLVILVAALMGVAVAYVSPTEPQSL